MAKECPYKEYCGGCQLQGNSYRHQLSIKQEKINKLLSNFCYVEKIIGMSDPLHYRNKIQVSFGLDDKKKVVCGNYIPSTHIIVPIEECMISDELSLKIIQHFKELIIKYQINIFNENSLKGCVRHLQVRCTNLNEYMVIIVVGSTRVPKVDLLVKELTNKFKEIKTIVLNFNNKHTSMVLGQKNEVVFGKGYINDILCGLKFKLSASSFYQVNKRQTEALYNTALKLVNLKGDEVAIDAYCGIGTITLALSKQVKEVIGVEINKRAIQDAIVNARMNDIKNVTFLADDAGHFMSQMARRNEKVDLVCMDPPRAGADEKFLSSLITLNPNKILYISCGPESLRNNLKVLKRAGYKIKKIQPVDMFPFSDHVETIVVLTK